MNRNTNRINYVKRMQNMKNKMNFTGDSSRGSALGIIITLIFIGLVIFLLVRLYQYYYTNCANGLKTPIQDFIFNVKNGRVCLLDQNGDGKLGVPQLPRIKEEVYHISNQDYTFDQAKCKCESYGGKLATVEQVKDAYNKGATWCTYGWTEGQNAYYPVQKCDWDVMMEENIHKPDDMKNVCGNPGLNGGYFADKNVKFGCNCYGVKPKGKVIKVKKPYCTPQQFCKLERNYEASHRMNTDQIAPFSPNQWNA